MMDVEISLMVLYLLLWIAFDMAMPHTQAIFLSPEATVANRNVAPWLRFRKFVKDAFHYITILPKVPSVEMNSG